MNVEFLFEIDDKDLILVMDEKEATPAYRMSNDIVEISLTKSSINDEVQF